MATRVPGLEVISSVDEDEDSIPIFDSASNQLKRVHPSAIAAGATYNYTETATTVTNANVVKVATTVTNSDLTVEDGATYTNVENAEDISGTADNVESATDISGTATNVESAEDISGTATNVASATNVQNAANVESATNSYTYEGTYVSDGDGYPCISQTQLDVDASIAADAWESVGPTDSGADNIWTALDGLQTDIDWVRVKITLIGVISGATPGTFTQAVTYGRKNGSSASNNSVSMLAEILVHVDPDGKGGAATSGVFEIPVSSRMFDFRYTIGSLASIGSNLTLVAAGYNKS
jgi:hypothetical protein